MNGKKNTSLLSVKKSAEVSHRDVAVSTESSSKLDDGQAPPRSNEDYFGLLSTSDNALQLVDREPVFVIVDSSCISNPSSRELLVEEQVIKGREKKKHYNKNVQPIDMPSTSRDFRNSFTPLKRSDSNDEMQMIEINLQSDNEIPVDENEIDNKSIVVSYLRNKDAHLDLEGAILSTKKKSSLLEDVPKMETIVEGKCFSSFPLDISKSDVLPNKNPDEEDPD